MQTSQSQPLALQNLQSISVNNLILSYSNKNIISSAKFSFKGIQGKDVYNITSPFLFNGAFYIAARVESRNSEIDSKVMFFKKENNNDWVLDSIAPILNLQDPFISIINSELILGGVEISHSQNIISYKTVFFKGDTIYNLQKFAEGPQGMKDIRLTQLNNSIGIFTRPQGLIGGRGRIGFFTISSIESLKNLTDKDYLSATIITDFLPQEEWIGSNAIYPLTNGQLAILGHIANFSENSQKNYYPISFCFNPSTKEISKMKILARREDLPQGESKRPDLKNILFSGGLARQNDGTAKLYLGASDAESYEITIPDPFIDYINSSAPVSPSTKPQ